jgi:hypothetical protein
MTDPLTSREKPRKHQKVTRTVFCWLTGGKFYCSRECAHYRCIDYRCIAFAFAPIGSKCENCGKELTNDD